MQKKIFQWIDVHKQELVEDTIKLCSIPSVQGEAEEGKPFGPGPYEALMACAGLCKAYGFHVKNYDNYVAAADFDPSLPHTLDILGHMDVVPAGDGWTVTEPFSPLVKEGRIYGRGTSDDKGPMLCALYALRAIKEAGVPLKKGVRLIMGSDEETGSSDIRHYYSMEKEAPMTFSPDAEFPLINIEKGQFRGCLKAEFEPSDDLPRLVSLEAGIALNAVPGKALVSFEGLDLRDYQDLMKELEAELGVQYQLNGSDQVTVIGAGAHASTPEEGKNAGLAAVLLALRLPLAKGRQTELLNAVSNLFPWGKTDGSGLGIKMSDDKSGDLTCSLDLFHMTEEECSFSFDARTPLCADEDNCLNAARKRAETFGFTLESTGMVPPHAVAEDTDFVQTLLGAYEEVTGKKGTCLAIGGGTYVHDIKNGLAFGACPEGADTRMHGADEFMPIDAMVLAAKVYAEAVLRLCG